MSSKEIETIMEIAHKSQTAERLFTFFALKMRHRKTINVNKTRKYLIDMGEIINESDFMEVFSLLVKYNYGRFRSAKEFEFNHPMYQIGRAGLEGKSFSQVNKPLDRPITNPIYDVKHLEDNKKYKNKEIVRAPVIPKQMPISLVSKSVTDKTIVYFRKDGKYVKLMLEGDISTEEVENIVATLESRPVSA